ncbi:MAG TPA: hypothetical protein VF043_33490 [Ktedonobacteraceae bacterium]
MGQATRTTRLSFSLDKGDQGGANSEKRALLDATIQVPTQARTGQSFSREGGDYEYKLALRSARPWKI